MCFSENSFAMESSINVTGSVQDKTRQVLKIYGEKIPNPKYLKISKGIFSIECS